MYEEMPENKKKIVKVVTEQVIAMLDNNVLNGYGTEGFMGWLEDGDVFANSDERLTEEEIEEEEIETYVPNRSSFKEEIDEGTNDDGVKIDYDL